MKAVFADTSFYVALLSPTDALHETATTLMSKLDCRVVLTDFILLELGNMFNEGDDRPRLVRLINSLRQEPNMLIVPASRRVFQDALDLFGNRPDKEWSLTDCSSFIVMDEYDLTEALSSDHHFEQAGFTILLK